MVQIHHIVTSFQDSSKMKRFPVWTGWQLLTYMYNIGIKCYYFDFCCLFVFPFRMILHVVMSIFNKKKSVFHVSVLLDDEFCHNMIKVAVDLQTTLTMLWQNSLSITGQMHEKLTSICFIMMTKCQIFHSCSLTHRINYKFMCLFAYWQFTMHWPGLQVTNDPNWSVNQQSKHSKNNMCNEKISLSNTSFII